MELIDAGNGERTHVVPRDLAKKLYDRLVEVESAFSHYERGERPPGDMGVWVEKTRAVLREAKGELE